MCAWSRGNSSHHKTFILYSHTASHATDTHLRLPLLPNHAFCSKAWNHSPDPLRQETDLQAYSQNLSRIHAQSAHYWVQFSPTYIFPKSLGIGRASVMALHVHTGSDRRANRETNTTDRRTQTAYCGITAEQYLCDSWTYQDPAGLLGIHPRPLEIVEEAMFRHAYTLLQIKYVFESFCYSKLWHRDQRACSNKAGKTSYKLLR